jgi:hypothetical protein
MEGSYYQKAIQSASKIRKVPHDVKVYAYYASDNPLETGSTLASGGLGTRCKTDVFDYHKNIGTDFNVK